MEITMHNIVNNIYIYTDYIRSICFKETETKTQNIMYLRRIPTPITL